MIAEVWQATKNQFTKYASEHVHVADVELPDDTKVLEMAYELTNHIDCPWWDNKEVTYLEPDATRSTSVGDFIKINGETWRVDMVGFSKVDD